MKTILLIEDNLDVRENTAEILELADYNIITAENGKIGVELAKKNLPDLIICDIMMPELDGYGVLHILSKNVKTSSIPFIFLTAKADKSDFRKGMNLGADDYLTKPFEETELLDAIESRLRKNEWFKNSFQPGEEGLNQLYDQAKSLEELKNLSLNRQTRKYQKKDTVYREGSYPHEVFLITKGTVKTTKIDNYGKELITNLYKAGEFLGFIPVIEESEYQETAIAMEDVDVSIIPVDDFVSLLNTNRDVSRMFIKMLANDVEEKEEKLLRLAYSSVRERVATALLELADKYNSLQLKLSREDLANIVGTAPETLIRALSEMKKSGIIESKGKEITILDNNKLQKEASM